jgi:quinol-cytochrome oxidoreductase complex cytochrome b subunit
MNEQRTQKNIFSRMAFWFKDRLARVDLFDETLQPKHPKNPIYYMGSFMYFCLIAQIVVGCILALYYIPTTADAYRSVQFITQQWKMFGFPIGFWLRGFHRYSADGLIVLAMLRFLRFYFTADYKKPNEMSWFNTIIFAILTTVFGFSGYVLPLDQRAYWATAVGTTMPTAADYLPFIGNLKIGSFIQFIARGGTVINQNTISRFYALHYILPLLIILLVEAYFYFTRKRRINVPAIATVVFAIILLSLNLIFPVASEAQATPDSPPAHILPDWYFLFVYYFLKIFPKINIPAIGFTLDSFAVWTFFLIALMIFLFLMPWIEKNPYREARKRPLWIALGLLGVALFVVTSYRSAEISDNVLLQKDTPFILGAYVLVILIFGFWQRKVYINERKKGELVHKK